jgi:hypothetical protein
MATITVHFDSRRDVYQDRAQSNSAAAPVRYDYREEPNGSLSILDVSAGDRAALELVRYATGTWVKVERSPGRIRRIEEWEAPVRAGRPAPLLP